MNIEQDLRDALRRQPAPADLADRVIARIGNGDAGVDTSRAPGAASAGVLRMPAARPGGTATMYRRTSWLAAAAAAVIVAVAGAQYSASRAAAAEAARVQRDIQAALQITSETVALVQERVERSARDSAR